MVSSKTKDTTSFFDCSLKASKLQVHSFHRTNYCIEYTCMSNHISVREVQTDMVIFTALDCFNYFVCNFCTFHPWALFKWNYVRWNFNIIFELFVKLALLVSVEEVCYVSVLLCFRNCKKLYTSLCKIFTHCAVNAWWVYKILCWNMSVSVVFHHTGIFNSRYAYTAPSRIRTRPLSAADTPNSFAVYFRYQAISPLRFFS